MKIVIIGGTGRIGSKLANKLLQLGHEVLAASPTTGVNTVTRGGLEKALNGAQVVVDVSNSPSFEGKVAMEFFQASGRNLLAAEASAGVKHHVALSIVGTDRPNSSDYFHAKLAQEKLVIESGIPYSILHSTQFFEFTTAIVQSGTVGQEVHIPTAIFQPIAADDVVSALADIALSAPLNSTVEVAGPVRLPMDEFIDIFFKATNDSRQLVPDKHALYFGAQVNDQSLIPGINPRIGKLKFEKWISTQYEKI
jgi:uncharacterized protein YbjT (DUF2867 family)